MRNQDTHQGSRDTSPVNRQPNQLPMALKGWTERGGSRCRQNRGCRTVSLGVNKRPWSREEFMKLFLHHSRKSLWHRRVCKVSQKGCAYCGVAGDYFSCKICFIYPITSTAVQIASSRSSSLGKPAALPSLSLLDTIALFSVLAWGRECLAVLLIQQFYHCCLETSQWQVEFECTITGSCFSVRAHARFEQL